MPRIQLEHFILLHLDFRVRSVYKQFIGPMQETTSNDSGITIPQIIPEPLDDTLEVAVNDRAVRPSVVHQAVNIESNPETSNIANVKHVHDDSKEIENQRIETVQFHSEPSNTLTNGVANNRKRRKMAIPGNPNKKQKLTNNSDKHINTARSKVPKRQNSRKRKPRQYECYLCKKSVHHKNHLQNHMRMHNGKVYRCSKCYEKFNSAFGLRYHMKKHADLYPFQCKRCRLVFSHRKKWNSHESRCKLKQYKCQMCGKIVAHKHSLIYHMQMHAGKMFDCLKCCRQFRSARGLKIHKCIKKEN